MRIIHLLSYMLVWSIIPLMAEYSARGKGRGLDFALWAVFVVMASLTIYGYCKREDRDGWLPLSTWKALVRAKHWGWFVALSLFTLASHLCAVIAFQGGLGVSDPGSATVATIVDSVVALLAGMAVTLFLEEMKQKRQGLTRALRSLWPGGSRFMLLSVTVACSVLFLVVKDRQAGLDWGVLGKPVVIFACSWSILAAVNNQIIRDYATAGIPRADFLFFRFCGPTVLLGSVLVGRVVWQDGLPEFDRDTGTGLLALGAGFSYAALLQFAVLKDRKVMDLNIADLVIPGLTFVLALVLGSTGGRTSWVSVLAIVGVVLGRLLAEVEPRSWRVMWHRRWPMSEPTTRLARWLLGVNVLGLLLTFFLFSPVAVDFLVWVKETAPKTAAAASEPGNARGGLEPQPQAPEPKAATAASEPLKVFLEQGNILLFLVLFVGVSQLVAMTFLARRVRNMIGDTVVGTVGSQMTDLAHNLKSHLALAINFARRVKDGDVHDVADLRESATSLERKCERGQRLIQAVLDASKLDKPLFCKRSPTDLTRFFDELRDEFRDDLSLGRAAFTVDHRGIPPGTHFLLDGDRLSIVLETLLDNSIRAWRGDRARDRLLEGLEITVAVRLLTDGLVIEFKDNGPGLGDDLQEGPEAAGGGPEGQVDEEPASPTPDALDAWLGGSPGGYGLGQHIVRRYVAAHDDGAGREGVVTWANDNGCKVTILLREPATASA